MTSCDRAFGGEDLHFIARSQVDDARVRPVVPRDEDCRPRDQRIRNNAMNDQRSSR